MTENRYTWDDPLSGQCATWLDSDSPTAFGHFETTARHMIIPGHLVAEIHRLAVENAKLRGGELPEKKLVPDAVLESVRAGATTTERLRIRRELLEAAREVAWNCSGRFHCNGTVLLLADLEDALDRICPEER